MIPEFQPPTPSRTAQLQALRAQFPNYRFNVLRRRTDAPRIEALSKTGGNPYCLISENAQEIWQELAAAA